MMRFGAVCNQFPLTHFISTQLIELTVKHFGELHCAFFFLELFHFKCFRRHQQLKCVLL